MAGTQMQLEDWLDDLCVRFIINLPQEDLSSVARICFQVEEAQWFYEDFIRPLDPTLPSMSLRTFCLRMFQHCPLLASFSVENHTQAFEEFLQYKTRIPVRGAILLNQAMDSTILVKGWKKGANWSFPRGKINKDEDDLDCAVREVYEETGLDLEAAGLVPKDVKPKYIEISMREQQLRLYVFRDVPMDYPFAPRTRKEISKIEWYKLSELPAFRRKGAADEGGTTTNANKFYMVAPFLVPLKKWVTSQKRQDSKRAANAMNPGLHPQMSVDEPVTEDDVYAQPEPMLQQYQMPGPAAHALESATQELQRLLKVQPPTSGLQATDAQQSDKGSALLSILQPRSNGAAQYSQQYQQQQQQQPHAQVPHMPMDTYTQAQQAHNPQHLNNQHQAAAIPQQIPPNLPLGHGQQPAQWQYPNPPGGHPQVPPQPNFPSLPQQQPQQPRTSQPVNLVHPQPLPPQVQRAIFNQSAFQDNSQPRGHGASMAQQQPQQFAHHEQQPPPPPPPQQQQHLQQQAAPAGGPLSGQSMALLNAFKRAPAGGSNENERQALYTQQQHPQAQSQPQQQQQHHDVPVVQAQLAQLAVPSYANQNAAIGGGPNHQRHHQHPAHQPGPVISPKELAGVGVIPQKTDHRNALLGMFKSPTVGSASPASPAAAQAKPQQPPPPDLIPSLSNMSISNTAAASRNNGSPASHNAPAAAAAHARQPQHPQPPRILQRGQDPNNLPSPASSSPRHAPLSPSRPQQTTQKTQLLSLFGKQQSRQSSAAVPGSSPLAAPSSIASQEDGTSDPAAAGQPRPRLMSKAPSTAGSTSMSRRGSETPISPADQNFLLGYLQSVTNSAAATR